MHSEVCKLVWHRIIDNRRHDPYCSYRSCRRSCNSGNINREKPDEQRRNCNDFTTWIPSTMYLSMWGDWTANAQMLLTDNTWRKRSPNYYSLSFFQMYADTFAKVTLKTYHVPSNTFFLRYLRLEMNDDTFCMTKLTRGTPERMFIVRSSCWFIGFIDSITKQW